MLVTYLAAVKFAVYARKSRALGRHGRYAIVAWIIPYVIFCNCLLALKVNREGIFYVVAKVECVAALDSIWLVGYCKFWSPFCNTLELASSSVRAVRGFEVKRDRAAKVGIVVIVLRLRQHEHTNFAMAADKAA